MAPNDVTTVTGDEQRRVLDVFTLAFVDDPMLRWMMPDCSQYLRHSGMAQLAIGVRSLEHRTGLVLGDFSGAAFWLPPGIGPDEQAMAAFVEQAITEDTKRRELFGVVEKMAQFHPTEPHWYLAVLGVDPRVQGRGNGSLLMAHALARVDRDRLPAYLESSNPRNVPFYERHGFEVIGRIQSGSSPAIMAMLRRAR